MLAATACAIAACTRRDEEHMTPILKRLKTYETQTVAVVSGAWHRTP